MDDVYNNEFITINGDEDREPHEHCGTNLVLVSVASDQNIHIHFAAQFGKRFQIPPRHDGMAYANKGSHGKSTRQLGSGE